MVQEGMVSEDLLLKIDKADKELGLEIEEVGFLDSDIV